MLIYPCSVVLVLAPALQSRASTFLARLQAARSGDCGMAGLASCLERSAGHGVAFDPKWTTRRRPLKTNPFTITKAALRFVLGHVAFLALRVSKSPRKIRLRYSCVRRPNRNRSLRSCPFGCYTARTVGDYRSWASVVPDHKRRVCPNSCQMRRRTKL
jgi:hypothetical protein